MKQAPGIDYTWHAVTVTVEDLPIINKRVPDSQSR